MKIGDVSRRMPGGAAWLLLALSAGCGGGGEAHVGGRVSGLAEGTAVTLRLNGGETLVIGADGRFEFDDALASGRRYEVSIVAQPARATCTVANGSGSIDRNAADVDDVAVVCTQRRSVGGVVSGLAAGSSVTLQNNGADTLAVAANGPFAFPTLLLAGDRYAVAVSQQPAGRTCSVGAGSGTVGTADVSSVVVECADAGASTAERPLPERFEAF